MKEDLYTKLKNVYTDTQKEIAVTVLFIALLVDILPDGIIPSQYDAKLQQGLIFALSLIMVGVLFEILTILKENNTQVETLEYGDLTNSIFKLIENERDIDIKYIAVAGLTGWPIIANMLDERDARNQLHKRSVNIEVAVISPQALNLFEKRTPATVAWKIPSAKCINFRKSWNVIITKTSRLPCINTTICQTLLAF